MDTYSTGTTSSGSVATRGTFTENTRVQIPVALHLVRLGYEYLSHIGDDDYDHRTNILKGIFLQSLKDLNPDITDIQAQKALDKLSRISANDDLGHEFYREITESMHGVVSFDYKLNDGRYLIGNGDYSFLTQWSECGTNSVYCYRDQVKRIGYNPFILDFPELDEIPTQFDFSSRCKALKVGNIVVLENKAGKFVAIKVLEVLKGNDDINHFVK